MNGFVLVFLNIVSLVLYKLYTELLLLISMFTKVV